MWNIFIWGKLGSNMEEINIKSVKIRLLELLRSEGLKVGSFKLSSGRVSDYYINGKAVTLSAEGAYLTAFLILKALQGEEFEALGGPTLGADPIVGAVALLSWLERKPLRTFIVRKQPKSYGTQRWIEGPLFPGDRVVIVDDVVTSGKSVMEAIKRVEEVGSKVVKVIAIVDREEGAREEIEKAGYRFQSLFTAKDIKNQKI